MAVSPCRSQQYLGEFWSILEYGGTTSAPTFKRMAGSRMLLSLKPHKAIRRHGYDLRCCKELFTFIFHLLH